MELKKLKFIALRGEGFFCIVKKYRDEATGLNYALKELKKKHYQRDDYRDRLIREIKLLKQLQECDNIVRLVTNGGDPENQKLWYLMPFAEYNLHDYIRKYNSTLLQSDRYRIIEKIINGIKFAHDKNKLHRDISPNNVLVYLVGGTPEIKVSDFGLGKDSESISHYTRSSTSGYGQILYVSPEQHNKLKDATKRSDIYSLGKLVYFVFTGKDPITLKQFELSSLVAKATEENPEDRYSSIHDFERHFNAIRDLNLNQTIPIEYITLKDIVSSGEIIDMTTLHEHLVKGNYQNHVYDDYIEPVTQYLLTKDNLNKYSNTVGTGGVRDFVKTYSARLDECLSITGWPFHKMATFGNLLKEIIQTVSDDETMLICFKHLWYLAFKADQWTVQSQIKVVLNKKYISNAIETQLSEYITETEVDIDLSHFTNLDLPKIVKLGIIKSKELAMENIKKEREEFD